MRKHRKKKTILTVYHPSRLKRGYSFENAVDGNAVTYTNEDYDSVGLYFLRGSQTGPQSTVLVLISTRFVEFIV